MLKQLLRLFVPTPIELGVYALAGIGLLFVASFTSIIDTISGDASVKANLTQLFSSEIREFLGDLQQRGGVSTAVTALFWAAIGGLVYAIVWVVVNFGVDLYNNVVISTSFVHPNSYHQSDHWTAFVGRTLFRVFMVFVILSYAILFARVLLPYWGHLFGIYVGNLGQLRSWWFGLVAVVGIVLSSHLFAVLFRLVFMRTRVFSNE